MAPCHAALLSDSEGVVGEQSVVGTPCLQQGQTHASGSQDLWSSYSRSPYNLNTQLHRRMLQAGREKINVSETENQQASVNTVVRVSARIISDIEQALLMGHGRNSWGAETFGRPSRDRPVGYLWCPRRVRWADVHRRPPRGCTHLAARTECLGRRGSWVRPEELSSRLAGIKDIQHKTLQRGLGMLQH